MHIVTDAKLKQQTETATTKRESSDIHTNTVNMNSKFNVHTTCTTGIKFTSQNG